MRLIPLHLLAVLATNIMGAISSPMERGPKLNIDEDNDISKRFAAVVGDVSDPQTPNRDSPNLFSVTDPDSISAAMSVRVRRLSNVAEYFSPNRLPKPTRTGLSQSVPPEWRNAMKGLQVPSLSRENSEDLAEAKPKIPLFAPATPEYSNPPESRPRLPSHLSKGESFDVDPQPAVVLGAKNLPSDANADRLPVAIADDSRGSASGPVYADAQPPPERPRVRRTQPIPSSDMPPVAAQEEPPVAVPERRVNPYGGRSRRAVVTQQQQQVEVRPPRFIRGPAKILMGEEHRSFREYLFSRLPTSWKEFIKSADEICYDAKDIDITESGGSFFYQYRTIRMIASGSYGGVYEVEDMCDPQMKVYALKYVRITSDIRESNYFGSISHEKEIMDRITTPSDYLITYKRIITLRDDELAIMNVMGQSLASYIEDLHRDERAIPTQTVAKITKMIALGIQHMHRNNVVHNDIKPQNILFSLGTYITSLKLIDFGSATYQPEVEAVKTNAPYSRGYVAPETETLGTTSKAGDVWSFGITIAEMILGIPLFNAVGLNTAGVLDPKQHFSPKVAERILKMKPRKKVARQGYTYDEAVEVVNRFIALKNREDMTELDKQMFDLLDKCLKFEESERITIEEVLGHPFLQDA